MQSPTNQRDRTGKHQHGFSLIDLMVGLALGLVALAAVGVVYVNSSKNYAVQEGFARMQESGRIAIEMIMRDLRQAGYFGCADDISTVWNHVIKQDDLSRLESDLFDTSNPVDAYEADEPTQWYPSNSTVPIDDILPNTDAFKVRGLGDDSIPVREPYMNTRAATLHVDASNGLAHGDLVAVTDCESADIFIINTANPDDSGELTHNSGSFVNGRGNDSAAACLGGISHCMSKKYEGDSSIIRFTAKRYFIGALDGGEPALFREDLRTGAREVVPGIENLQLLWGEDTGSDRIPDVYRKAHEVNWAAVVSARIGILARTQAQTRFGTDQEYGALGTDDRVYDLDNDGTNDAVTTSESDAKVERQMFYATVLLRNLQ